MTFKTLSEVRAANAAIGDCWFERGSMRFFNTRIRSALYGGRYFITSERYDLTKPCLYSIRCAAEDGSVDTVGEFQGYRHLEDARDAARRLAKAVTA